MVYQIVGKGKTRNFRSLKTAKKFAQGRKGAIIWDATKGVRVTKKMIPKKKGFVNDFFGV